ncbi:MAG: outer membrane protein assembly factor BamA [Bacteroidota bacterium]
MIATLPSLVLRRSLLVLGCALILSLPAGAQGLGQPLAQVGGAPIGAPASYEILGLSVEGVSDESARQFVLSSSGLRVGQSVTIPGDQAISDAIRQLYQLGNFADVDVLAERYVGGGVFLLVRVEEVPRLGEVKFEGVKGGDRDELKDRVPLLRGQALRPAGIERSEQIIRDYFAEKGFRLVTVETTQQATPEGSTRVTFDVSRGRKVEIGDINFAGNEAFDEKRLRKRLGNNAEDRWWRFWGASTFDEPGFEEDKQNLIAYYNDRGFYSARILRDSVYLDTSEPDDPEIVIDIQVEEGPKYHIRNLAFDGNAEYTDEQLLFALNIERGEVYSRSKLERSLFYDPQHTDITSLYSDRGYLRFNVQPQIVEVEGDSLDITFTIDEGDIYEFGEITVRGNTRTKEHVIRRQLRTVPGQTYSRQALERSIRELIQLGYFDQQKLAEGPRVSIDEETKKVDLTYNLVETGGDQLELSGGWGGSGFGLILQARVAFNNFSIQNVFNGSAWRPVPSGDGQQLALSVQTSGLRYQSYSATFTEPWFRGRNTPIGGSLSYTFRDFSNNSRLIGLDESEISTVSQKFSTFNAGLFYRQALTWPDDFFQSGTNLGYRLYDLTGESLSRSYGLPQGTSQELTVRQSLTRNSFDAPQFPTAGSSLLLSAEVALPIPGFIQYHKEKFSTRWVTPIAGRLALDFSADYAYIGSLTGGDVEFQRFLVGGSPLEAQSTFQGYGKDIVFMRGYPTLAITPVQNGRRVGGRILNKYSMEARVVAIQTPQFTAAPYLFVDAANTWNSFDDYNPTKLFRSAGFGAKLFLPFLGLIDLNYGYQIDSFTDIRGNAPLEIGPQWRFQFSLGGQ